MEMERESIMSSSLPSDLVEKLSKVSAKCEGVWEKQEKNLILKLLITS